MCYYYWRKLCGIGCLCAGCAILLVILLPKLVWLLGIGIILALVGSYCLFC